jgi:type I restriction enzyme S subunit
MNEGRLLAHYERIADAPDAIRRLRRFVLDLAVRGKLVPQDPNDELASELLKRITKEKARTEKRQQDVPEIENFQGLGDVPANWCAVPLIALGSWAIGAGFPKNEQGASDGPYFFLKVSDMNLAGNEKYITTANNSIDDEAASRMRAKIHPPGTIIFPKIGGAIATNKRRILTKGAAIDNNCLGITFSSKIDTEWAYLLLTTLDFTQYQAGTALPALQQGTLERIPIGLPPLAEQHRIVAKVDELMALCDRLEAARAEREAKRDRLTAASLARLNTPDPNTFRDDARFTLDALPELTARADQIKQLRQTVLILAVRGKLVPQDPNDEPASEPLKRLKEAQVVACSREGLRTRPPIAKLRREEIKFSFPECWALASFEDIFVIVSGVTKGQKVAASAAIDVPYLRVANVQRGHLDLAVIKKITVRKGDEQRYELLRGDILMTEGGDWDKLGRAAVWRGEIAGCIHQNHIFRVRPPSRDILPEWVTTYVNSLLGRAFFEDASKQTTNLASINMTQLRGCPIPLPPVPEQRRIVAKVDELMALCDRLEASLTTAADTRRLLLDALLAEALAPDEERELEAAE